MGLALRLQIVAIVGLLTLPFHVHAASFEISEVMYDAEGADTKHEWIEIRNTGTTLDISDWKLFEGGVNHKLSIYAGSAVIPAGGYAIIADDAATFLADFPAFSGIVFDTALSGGLSNSSGETLTLRDAALSDIHTVTYDPQLGAAGDGKSLQKIGSSWQALSPTPGAALSGSTQQTTQEDSTGTISESPTTSSSAQGVAPNPQIGGGVPVEPQMRVFAGDDRVVVAGASTVFTGNAVGLKGEPLSNARYVWSFGNGDTREGKSVLYAFPYPGKYVVTLEASSEVWSASDRIIVSVLLADVSVSAATSEYIELENQSDFEIDVGLWQLVSQGKVFTFPLRTIILGASKIRINLAATGLSVASIRDVSLLYPNGAPAASYTEPLFLPVPSSSVSAPHTRPAMQPSVDEEREAGEENSLVAAAVLAKLPQESRPVPYVIWVLGVGVIVALGVGAALYIRRRTSTSS